MHCLIIEGLILYVSIGYCVALMALIRTEDIRSFDVALIFSFWPAVVIWSLIKLWAEIHHSRRKKCKQLRIVVPDEGETDEHFLSRIKKL